MSETDTRTSNKIGTVAAGLVFLIGLCILLYPVASDLWNQWRQNSLMSGYDAAVSQLSDAEAEALWKAAQEYNAALDPSFSDAFTGEEPAVDDGYWKQLAVDDTGIMGYIEIPKISIKLPIYHGTGEKALQEGTGHLAGTSLPVGGEGTHCVISGHRGLPSALLFTDLDQLEKGDRFALHVLGHTLAYEVDQILVVDPDEVSALKPEETGDYVTLLTCTPYGVNTQRLLVRGHRVEDMGDAGSVDAIAQVLNSLGWKGKLLLALLVLLIVALIIRAVSRRSRKKDEPLGKHAAQR